MAIPADMSKIKLIIFVSKCGPFPKFTRSMMAPLSFQEQRQEPSSRGGSCLTESCQLYPSVFRTRPFPSLHSHGH